MHSRLAPILAWTFALAACGHASEEPGSPDAESSSGAEAADDESDVGEATAEPADEAAAQAPDPLQQVQGKVIQLGVNKAALEQTLSGPQIDCGRAGSQRDRICSLTDDICAVAETSADAQAQCDNARAKCEKARADVKHVRCK